MNAEALAAAKAAYQIEADCILEELAYLDDEQFMKAVDALAKAPRIGTAGCGHSGIICQHMAHLMCCIERPARFISPMRPDPGSRHRAARRLPDTKLNRLFHLAGG